MDDITKINNNANLSRYLDRIPVSIHAPVRVRPALRPARYGWTLFQSTHP